MTQANEKRATEIITQALQLAYTTSNSKLDRQNFSAVGQLLYTEEIILKTNITEFV